MPLLTGTIYALIGFAIGAGISFG
ncbi:uncharacterized protein METZ01_LOCUS263653, partial [marine metagenome]